MDVVGHGLVLFGFGKFFSFDFCFVFKTHIYIYFCRNFIWFVPLDYIKFAMQYIYEPKSTLADGGKPTAGGSRRASAMSGTSSARYYANRTRSLRSMERPQNLGQKLLGKNKLSSDPKEMRRFSSAQTSQAAQVLNN
jgi:H+-transporting ATPase